jgi:hypothetical protein
MTLPHVLDPLAARLASGLTGVTVGDVAPAAAVDLPRAVLTLDGVGQALAGVGGVQRGTRTGALQLSAAIDLADPVLDLGGEKLPLLSADRRTLTLPHGPVVRADGTPDPPRGPDLSADDGAAFTVVDGAPTGRQVRADPAAGTLLFGTALATTGTLRVTYHVGQWDTVTTRVQGTLAVEVIAAGAQAVADTSRDLADALAATDPAARITPLSWGASRPERLPDETDVRAQTATYHLDAELEEPVLTSGGGVITRIRFAASLAGGGAVEPFAVPRGATP